MKNESVISNILKEIQIWLNISQMWVLFISLYVINLDAK